MTQHDAEPVGVDRDAGHVWSVTFGCGDVVRVAAGVARCVERTDGGGDTSCGAEAHGEHETP